MKHGELSVILVFSLLRATSAWHQFSNTLYHCWPLSASAASPQPYDPCPGVDISWVVSPPESITEQVEFNTTTQIALQPSFYSWAVGLNLFGSANGTGGISNAVDAQQWCENTVCPAPASATQENCCIHHMNIHSCPMASSEGTIDVCGPWIPATGQVYTHSVVLVGSASQAMWSNFVGGLYVTGQSSIIAHFKIAGISIALVKILKVLPKTVCGDGSCDEDETCSTCRADCGACPLLDWDIVLIVLGVVALAAVLIGLLVKIQYQKRKLLFDESWIYQYDTIIHEIEPRHAFGSCVSRRTIGEGLDDVFSTTGSLMGCKQMFATTGIVDGKTVTIKIVKKANFSLTRRIREEVREARTMDHNNLCKFVGGCIKVPEVCILMEYCPKGSLIDVLLNDDIPLTWSFRLSFATDIARGMTYLHGHDMFHGRLKSHNCVIDDRWCLKITDYGLPVYRTDEIEDEDVDHVMKGRRYVVYQGPEFNSTRPSNDTLAKVRHPTGEGDVYAFAIILVEVATRNEAYEDNDWSSLPLDWKPPVPTFGKDEDSDNICPCPRQYCNLITSCWSSNPKERPNFDLIKKRLHKMNPNKLNPVDLMMNMMEKYSKHLESLVTERTKELILEKQKTDRLLYNMLPKSVADELRHGRPVEAETYDTCTIFFSDIVGFTSLSGGSTPMQVVALLNKLYITFDEIIDKFDVYKVETIGDAYMVVSGVPKPTESHAAEIAKMALELVAASKIFEIPHRKDENLKIRVGLHSGHVCAGVVGLKMPRYCLFGDTVNTASRMESNGEGDIMTGATCGAGDAHSSGTPDLTFGFNEAYKIHLSDCTHNELIRKGGFTFNDRGTIPIKGKGEMRTWWLLSSEDQKPSRPNSKLSRENTDLLIEEYIAESDKMENELANTEKNAMFHEKQNGSVNLLENLNTKLLNGKETDKKGVTFE